MLDKYPNHYIIVTGWGSMTSNQACSLLLLEKIQGWLIGLSRLPQLTTSLLSISPLSHVMKFLLQLVFSCFSSFFPAKNHIKRELTWHNVMLHYLFWKRVSSRNLTIHTSFRSSHYYSIILKPNMGHSICQIPSSKKQGLKYSKGGKLSKLCLSQKVRVNKKQDLQ